METPKQPTSQSAQPSGGIGGDVRRLKSDGAATASELQEFFGRMRGRSPQEVLGMVAKSGLTRSIVVATLGFAVLLVACTVIPYYLDHRPAAAGAGAPDSAADGPDATRSDPANDAPGGTETPAGGDDTSAPGVPDGEKAVEALGIGQTKTADPDKNPLEGKLDDLLDKID